MQSHFNIKRTLSLIALTATIIGIVLIFVHRKNDISNIETEGVYSEL